MASMIHCNRAEQISRTLLKVAWWATLIVSSSIIAHQLFVARCSQDTNSRPQAIWRRLKGLLPFRKKNEAMAKKRRAYRERRKWRKEIARNADTLPYCDVLYSSHHDPHLEYGQANMEVFQERPERYRCSIFIARGKTDCPLADPPNLFDLSRSWEHRLVGDPFPPFPKPILEGPKLIHWIEPDRDCMRFLDGERQRKAEGYYKQKPKTQKAGDFEDDLD